MEGELGLLDEFDGSEVLVYEKNKVVFWEKKEEPLPKPLYDTRFQGFIQDLEKLVQKYL
ncbi:MAG: hypothetical protein LBP53_04135 [Candidatus Peribacteria bacterium]|jgi:hypothetical protein|nr:hypothetical protein [Candidatus Peribacteria bacterium]